MHIVWILVKRRLARRLTSFKLCTKFFNIVKNDGYYNEKFNVHEQEPNRKITGKYINLIMYIVLQIGMSASNVSASPHSMITLFYGQKSKLTQIPWCMYIYIYTYVRLKALVFCVCVCGQLKIPDLRFQYKNGLVNSRLVAKKTTYSSP